MPTLTEVTNHSELYLSGIQLEHHAFKVDKSTVDYFRRYPLLESEATVDTFVLPKKYVPVTFFHPKYSNVVNSINHGLDVLGVLKGGASGAELARLQSEGVFDPPSRQEEYAAFMLQNPTARNVLQFQVGGYPFNLGTLFFERNGTAGINCVTSDTLLKDDPMCSGLFGDKSRFVGLAVDFNGNLVPEDIEVALKGEFSHNISDALPDKKRFIAVPCPLVLNGSPVSLHELVTKYKNTGDPRHIWGLPYIGGVKDTGSYDGTLSGSLFLFELGRLLQQGKGEQLLASMISQDPFNLTLDESSNTFILLQGLIKTFDLKTPGSNIGELRKYGIISGENPPDWKAQIEKILQLGSVDLQLAPAVYPHLIWGIMENGQLAVSITSGLINGVVSGQNGLTIEMLGECASKIGYAQCWIGSQGRDVPQIYLNGVNVAAEPLGLGSYKDVIDRKKATSPSIFLVAGS